MPEKNTSDKTESEKKPSTDNSDVADVAEGEAEKKKPLDPTRYGDWEKNGRCIDF